MSKSKTVLSNIIWRFMERTGAQAVAALVEIILARLLDPEHYGVIALVTVFTRILQVFIDSGFANALIQKKDADQIDFSSVFYFNLCMCAALYTFVFFASPLISRFYKMPELTPVTRVLSLVLIASGLKSVQQAYVSRHLLFKRFFWATLTGTVLAAIVGIAMAWRGYGVWALVVQHLVNTVVDTIMLWITVKWRPTRQFSWKRLKGLLSFGWKLFVSNLINTVYNDLRQLIIGRRYSSSDLALYNRGGRIPRVFVTNINSAIDSVLFPAMSAVQDNRDRVREMTRRAIMTSSYLLMPLMTGLAVCAEPLIQFVLTEKWLPVVFYLRVFCFTYAFFPIHTANLNAIKAMGRSDLFLKLEIIKKVVGLTALLITMRISVMAMAYSLLVTSVLSQIINSWPNRKLLDYHFLDQLRDILPNILLAMGMGLIVYPVKYLGMNDWITLLIQFSLGVLIYLLGSILFHLESYDYTRSMLRAFFSKEKIEFHKHK